nr:hypothetical protein StreXyl84_33320 [Streptomyces sp. Xyl84]
MSPESRAPRLVTDRAGTVRDANPAAARLTGLPAEALTGTLPGQLLPREVCDLLTARRAARPDGFVDATAALARADGRRLPVRVVTWPAGPLNGDLICCLLPLPRPRPPPRRHPGAPARPHAPAPVSPAEARILEGLARKTRHTRSSLLVALKVHQEVAQRILRHSQIAMTMEVYAEASEEEVRAAIGKPSDAMGGTG